MGAWGYKPADSDKSREWLYRLWENYPFQREVEKALQLNVDDYPEIVRAAAFMIYGTRNLFVWDPDDYSRFALLAIRNLEAIKRMEIYSDREFQDALAQEIEQLIASLE